VLFTEEYQQVIIRRRQTGEGGILPSQALGFYSRAKADKKDPPVTRQTATPTA
tara:strand:- start:164 stop:322 length:159 start_codon:yes stop_codon:yes gene_type:complete